MKLDVEAFTAIVEALRDGGERYFPGRDVRDVSWEKSILRDYSQLTRLRITFGDGESAGAFVKLYRHPEPLHTQKYPSAEEECRAHETLYDLFSDVEDCTVVHPIAVFPEWGGWVLRRLQESYLEGFRSHVELSPPALQLHRTRNMLRMLNSLIRTSKHSLLMAPRTRAGIGFARSWLLEQAG